MQIQRQNNMGKRPLLFPTEQNKNIFLFLKYVRLLVIWGVFSMIMLCCAPAQKISTKMKVLPKLKPPAPNAVSLGQNTQTLKTDLKTECQIPSSAQVIHYPMIHGVSSVFKESVPYSAENFFHESAAYSQFQLAQVISNVPHLAVFWEGASKMRTRESFNTLKYVDSLKEIGQWFLKDGSLKSFESLEKKEKEILVEIGGVLTAFLMGKVDIVYPSSSSPLGKMTQDKIVSLYKETRSLKAELLEYDSFVEYVQSGGESFFLANDSEKEEILEIIQQINEIEDEMDKLIYDDRELFLKREVQDVLTRMPPGQRAFIAYGAGHDLSDEFQDYNFYVLPEKCTMPQDFLHHPFYALNLIEKADRLRQSSTNTDTGKIYYQKAYHFLDLAIANHTNEKGEAEETSYWNFILDQPFTYSELKAYKLLAQLKHQGAGAEQIKEIEYRIVLALTNFQSVF